MTRHRFRVAISADEWLATYSGTISNMSSFEVQRGTEYPFPFETLFPM